MTTTANRVLEVLKKAFNLAEDWEWRPDSSNPCRRIKKFAEKKRRRYLSAQECVRLYNVLVSYLNHTNYRARQVAYLVFLLLYTGARRGEMITCKWSYIVPERSVIALPDTKSNEPQDVRLGFEALYILERIRTDQRENGRPGDWLFDGHNIGDHLKDEGDHWDNIRAEAGLVDFRMHDLRHSFASFMAIATGSKVMIQQALRHADSSTSDRYTHMFDDPLTLAFSETTSKIKDVMQGKNVISLENVKRAKMEAIANNILNDRTG